MFPEWIHRIHVLFIPSLVIIAMLVYYLIRTLFTQAFQGKFLRPSERTPLESSQIVASVAPHLLRPGENP